MCCFSWLELWKFWVLIKFWFLSAKLNLAGIRQVNFASLYILYSTQFAYAFTHKNDDTIEFPWIHRCASCVQKWKNLDFFWPSRCLLGTQGYRKKVLKILVIGKARGFIRSRQLGKIAAYLVRIYFLLPLTLYFYSKYLKNLSVCHLI